MLPSMWGDVGFIIPAVNFPNQIEKARTEKFCNISFDLEDGPQSSDSVI